MDMVGHQHIGVNRTAAIASRFFQPMEVALAVLFGEEARLAIDAALNDVQRVIGEKNARAAWAYQVLRKSNDSDPFGSPAKKHGSRLMPR
jgi:hypothetical protein